jgi:hypothetical protein
VKPVPLTVTALTVTAAVPVDVRINDWVAGEFKFTLPKAIVAAFMLSVGTPAPNCNAKVFATPPALAVSVTVCPELTEDTVAVKIPVVDPAATVTVAGTVTAELLLARLTANPPLAAATFSVTVQLSLPALVIDPLLQLSPLNTGTPVPLRLITVELPLDELLVRVNEPAAAPAVAGSNCTVSVAV